MKLVVIDRDGVINQDDDGYIHRPEDWSPIAGSLEAIAALTKAGFTVVVMTNQSGIARGYLSEQDLTAIHEKMQAAVKKAGGLLSKIYYCPHHPDENCLCRKPQPGMLKQIALDFPNACLEKTTVIGDSWKDILAGRSMGCKTILVQTGYGKKALLNHQHEIEDTPVAADLSSAVRFILDSDGSGQ
jgi:D-glycero-D-manno-heptose 1,7-bisphosphate phosphatase